MVPLAAPSVVAVVVVVCHAKEPPEPQDRFLPKQQPGTSDHDNDHDDDDNNNKKKKKKKNKEPWCFPWVSVPLVALVVKGQAKQQKRQRRRLHGTTGTVVVMVVVVAVTLLLMSKLVWVTRTMRPELFLLQVSFYRNSSGGGGGSSSNDPDEANDNPDHHHHHHKDDNENDNDARISDTTTATQSQVSSSAAAAAARVTTQTPRKTVSYTLHRYKPYQGIYQQDYQCPATTTTTTTTSTTTTETTNGTNSNSTLLSPAAGRDRVTRARYVAETFDASSIRYRPVRRIPARHSTTTEQLVRRRPLHDSLQPLLNFTTSLHLNHLKILVQGDSVAMQYSQMLQEALFLSTTSSSSSNVLPKKYVYRYHVKKSKRESLHVLQVPANPGDVHRGGGGGGGMVAGWRLTSLWDRQKEGYPLPNHPGGGWSRLDLQRLLQQDSYHHDHPDNKNYNNHTQQQEQGQQNSSSSSSSFWDVLIVRTPTPWIGLENVTVQAWTETVLAAQELLGIQTILFLGLEFHNNIMTRSQVDMLYEKNRLLRQFVRQAQTQNPHITATLLVSAVDEYTWQVMKYNAVQQQQQQQQQQVRNESNESSLLWMSTTNRYFGLDSLKPRTLLHYQQSIAWVCDGTDTTVRPGDRECVHNQLTYDGVHGCMETMAGRFTANWACLLACVYNNSNNDDNDNNSNKRKERHYDKSNQSPQALLRACEQACNDQFMSLHPISDEMFGVPLS